MKNIIITLLWIALVIFLIKYTYSIYEKTIDYEEIIIIKEEIITDE